MTHQKPRRHRLLPPSYSQLSLLPPEDQQQQQQQQQRQQQHQTRGNPATSDDANQGSGGGHSGSRNTMAPAESASSASKSKISAGYDKDVVAIRGLQLPFGVIAPDVWGKPKEQPALVSVHLVLRYGFNSAALGDELDNSTIHYGELAKRIRGKCYANQTAGAVSAAVEDSVQEMAGKVAGHFLVSRCTVEVKLEKATMYGEGMTLVNALSFDETGKSVSAQRVLCVEQCRLMTLIGVNGYERSGKQPVTASIWLHLPKDSNIGGSQQMIDLFNIDQTLALIIEGSSFETLETLADFTVKRLQKQLLNQIMPGGTVQLKLEKSRAIPWAEAPYVEVLREIPRPRSSGHATSHSRSGSKISEVSTPPLRTPREPPQSSPSDRSPSNGTPTETAPRAPTSSSSANAAESSASSPVVSNGPPPDIPPRNRSYSKTAEALPAINVVKPYEGTPRSSRDGEATPV